MYSLHNGEKKELADGGLFNVKEGDRYTISCEAKGSNPAPFVSVNFDEDNLLDQFDITVSHAFCISD